ncbi:hypothetical protein GCM10010172_80240 [Paractinoplanes ferrugineus]|uniref:Uncharacterized protein n=1 Tax=Paractinoplanes ferrugineus TaxID=113564 RepID=A0A919MLE4_9ACTN|nr:hypothetical protein [Actinoplanes ferrugineus]GIE16740.1 hypothetical protein Afe05nite_85800 [Actinoplanes ferrugineus]
MDTVIFRNRITGRLVEAVQYSSENDREVFEWAPGKQHHEPGGQVRGMNVFTPEGRRRAVWGDWIFRDEGTDRFWVAPADGFDDDYELVAAEVPA